MATSFDDFPSIEPLKAREQITREWMLKAVGSLLSLWSESSPTAIRHSEDARGIEFRPTATFHSIIALAECGVWHPETTYDKRRERLQTPYGEVACRTPPAPAIDILRHLLEIKGASARRRDDLGIWVPAIIELSSHSTSEEKKPSTRFIIPLERLVSAVSSLLQVIADPKCDSLRPQILAGLAYAERELRKLLTRDGAPINAAELYESGDFAPGILLNVVTCFDSLAACYRRLDAEAHRIISADEIGSFFRRLRDATLRHVDYHMARQAVALDPSYDPVSLTFALRALCITSPEERRFAFFRACIDAIVARQHQDGCWPDGVSITFEPTADVVQQPSAGVALHLAECAIDNRAVTDHIEEERSLLDSVLPALRKTMQYLRSTHSVVEVDGRTYLGWSSDRVRRRNYAETWITAYSTRLLRRLWIGEKAALRNHALMRFGISEHRGDMRSLKDAAEAWHEAVNEPDSVTRPVEQVWTRIVQPILSKRTSGDLFQLPARDSVSFIIFGPPGSGKTFFVQRLASFIGWPLVTITPGHFIHRGLEFIEAVARDIFDHIRLLNHAVIFFDECDELFRTRDDENQRGTRSILSFATASMLPKLQDLHDAGNVVFVLGTNYLRNIDTAVRRPGRFDDILLFDRPDDAARERLIRKVVETAPPRKPISIPPAVMATRGLTVKEVRRYAEALAGGLPLQTETSLEDYREWCRRDSSGELQASRFDETTRAKVRARWTTITG
jgi:hypothetical protein